MAALQDTSTGNISAATNGQTQQLLLLASHQASISLSWVTVNTATSAIVGAVPTSIDESTTDPIDVASMTIATANKLMVCDRERGVYRSNARYPT